MYIVVSVWGYEELKATKHLPYFMGGTTDAKTAFESTMNNNPFCEYPRSLYNWFLFTFGIYVGELVRHVFIDEIKSDFGEMLIHHMATCFLVFGSAYANQVGIGCIISWIHLASDITASLIKVVASTHFADTTIVVFFIMMSNWFYFRLVCLPFWIFNLFMSPSADYPAHISEFKIFLQLNGLYLLVLQILQIYWFGLFIKMLIVFSRTGDAEDTQEDVKKNEAAKVNKKEE